MDASKKGGLQEVSRFVQVWIQDRRAWENTYLVSMWSFWRLGFHCTNSFRLQVSLWSLKMNNSILACTANSLEIWRSSLPGQEQIFPRTNPCFPNSFRWLRWFSELWKSRVMVEAAKSFSLPHSDFTSWHDHKRWRVHKLSPDYVGKPPSHISWAIHCSSKASFQVTDHLISRITILALTSHDRTRWYVPKLNLSCQYPPRFHCRLDSACACHGNVVWGFEG